MSRYARKQYNYSGARRPASACTVLNKCLKKPEPHDVASVPVFTWRVHLSGSRHPYTAGTSVAEPSKTWSSGWMLRTQHH